MYTTITVLVILCLSFIPLAIATDVPFYLKNKHEPLPKRRVIPRNDLYVPGRIPYADWVIKRAAQISSDVVLIHKELEKYTDVTNKKEETERKWVLFKIQKKTDYLTFLDDKFKYYTGSTLAEAGYDFEYLPKPADSKEEEDDEVETEIAKTNSDLSAPTKEDKKEEPALTYKMKRELAQLVKELKAVKIDQSVEIKKETNLPPVVKAAVEDSKKVSSDTTKPSLATKKDYSVLKGEANENKEEEKAAKLASEKAKKEAARLEQVRAKEERESKIAEEKAKKEAARLEQVRAKEERESKIAEEKAKKELDRLENLRKQEEKAAALAEEKAKRKAENLEKQRVAREEAKIRSEKLAEEKATKAAAIAETARLEKEAKKKAEEEKASRLAEEKLKREEERRLSEERKKKEIADKQAEAERIKAEKESKAKIEKELKEAEDTRIAKEKADELKAIKEAARLAEETALIEAEAANLARLAKDAEEKKKEEKARQEAESTRLAEEKSKAEQELKEVARLAEEAKKKAEEKARKDEETAKIAEENERKEAELKKPLAVPQSISSETVNLDIVIPTAPMPLIEENKDQNPITTPRQDKVAEEKKKLEELMERKEKSIVVPEKKAFTPVEEKLPTEEKIIKPAPVIEAEHSGTIVEEGEIQEANGPTY